jgi:hypothetical protein
MYHHIIWAEASDVSEIPVAIVFRIEVTSVLKMDKWFPPKRRKLFPKYMTLKCRRLYSINSSSE